MEDIARRQAIKPGGQSSPEGDELREVKADPQLPLRGLSNGRPQIEDANGGWANVVRAFEDWNEGGLDDE